MIKVRISQRVRANVSVNTGARVKVKLLGGITIVELPMKTFQKPKTTPSYFELIGDIDGSNNIFSFGEPYKSGSILLHYNGQQVGDFVELDPSAGTFQCTFIPKSGRQLTASKQ